MPELPITPLITRPLTNHFKAFRILIEQFILVVFLSLKEESL
jgi:hypothetical protein